VHRLEELGIGRPSTYAPTIQTIQNREYVVRGDREGFERDYNILTLKNNQITDIDNKEITGADRNKLLPTDIGTVVNDFLTQCFPEIMDYNFTANVEKEFDAISEGEMEWTNVMSRFYKTFHPTVEAASAIKTAHKVGERKIGTDPKSGKPVYVKIGRYGPVAQIGEASSDKKEKPVFASLLKGQSIETITLEEALKLFDLPRNVGEYEGETIVAGIGRFGPFIRYEGKFISIPKNLNPLTITVDEAIQLIEQRQANEKERNIKKFTQEPDLEVLNGRYGPYIAYKGANYKIPKTTDPKSLTLEQCLKIISDTPDKPAKKRFTRKR